jgi:2-keto-4-pentenoate hydratase/2-oxohepta-3-ene-1,7-dioic acid hydratase in catechol pathway
MKNRDGRSAKFVIVLVLIALSVSVSAVMIRDPEGLSIDNPRFDQAMPEADDRLLPGVVRYVSSLPDYRGKTCFGLVLSALDGIPEQVLNLTAVRPRLGSSFGTFLSHSGFDLADEMFKPAAREKYRIFIERIDQNELSETIKPPVDISMKQLETEERFIVGVGFNYSGHRDETDSDKDMFLFPKFLEPGGAYHPVTLGKDQALSSSQLDILTDYEAEIGFVLTGDIDLTHLPADEDELLEKIAFFAANDLSDRLPVILEGETGFTKAKSHPTYLPAGPWMVHGRYLKLKTVSGGDVAVRLSLLVDEHEPFPGGPWRQDASSVSMIRGPLEIIRMAAEIYRQSSRPDINGVMRHIAREENGSVVIPAGSMFLTGTPGGTAIEAPSKMDMIRLLLLGNFSLEKAKTVFARHCLKNRKEMGFLHAGDRVETRIQYLGRQIWEVKE